MKTFLLVFSFILVSILGLKAGSITSAGSITNLTPSGFGIGTDVADFDTALVGQEGFVLFNSVTEGSNLGGRPWNENIVNSLPAYITNLDGSASTSSGGWANYDNILVGGTTYNTGGIVFSPGNGVETALFNFTIGAEPPPVLRVSLIADNSDNANWDATNVRIEGPVAETANQDVTRDGGLDLVQFDIGAATEGEVYTVYATSPPSGALIGGIAFDLPPTDSDSDGLPNEFEITYGLDPNSAAGDDGASGDPDGDNLDNITELELGTNPTSADTDMDGYNDDVENNTGIWSSATAGTGTDPLNQDSDGDGLKDGNENPDLPYDPGNASGQPGTNPNLDDTDLDGASDGFEITSSTDPTSNASTPEPSASLWSVDMQGIPGIFPSDPVLMTGSDPNSGFYSGIWNAFNIVGHDGIETNPSMTILNARGEDFGVSFTVTGIVSSWSNPPGANTITNDYLFIGAGGAEASATWDISGLSPATDYTFYPYGGIARDVLMTVDTNGNGLLTDETPTLVAGAGVEFTVTSDTSGKIIGKIDAGSSPEANWGGWQLASNSDIVIIDTDGDGLSDNAENAAGTDRFNPDTDGDGHSDGDEVRGSGTDPLDRTSFLGVTNIFHDGDSVDLTWTSVDGKIYLVEGSTNLVDWVELNDNIPATGTLTTATVDVPGETPFKAYRVVAGR